MLRLVLPALGPIWPGRLSLDGVPLGDCGRHAAVPGDGLVPFHKLSQWLVYSLIEPLADAGFTITDIDGLTGLAEYRNGGLFLDTGVLVAARPRPAAPHARPVRARVVEWRALTIVLLDRLAERVRERLGLHSRPNFRSPRCSKAAAGPPAARLPPSAARMARRRCRSPATARFSDRRRGCRNAAPNRSGSP